MLLSAGGNSPNNCPWLRQRGSSSARMSSATPQLVPCWSPSKQPPAAPSCARPPNGHKMPWGWQPDVGTEACHLAIVLGCSGQALHASPSLSPQQHPAPWRGWAILSGIYFGIQAGMLELRSFLPLKKPRQMIFRELRFGLKALFSGRFIPKLNIYWGPWCAPPQHQQLSQAVGSWVVVLQCTK